MLSSFLLLVALAACAGPHDLPVDTVAVVLPAPAPVVIEPPEWSDPVAPSSLLEGESVIDLHAAPAVQPPVAATEASAAPTAEAVAATNVEALTRE